jgi:hypothetical protein
MKVAVAQENSGIQALVQRALKVRRLSRQEHLKLTSAMLTDPAMVSADRYQINRLLDCVRAGKIQLVD